MAKSKIFFSMLVVCCLQLLPNKTLGQDNTTFLSGSVDIPEGIQNIGADMIKLVDQIIFGERDPTQRLSLAPLIEDIRQAIDASPTTGKSGVNLALSEAGIKQLEQSKSFSVTGSGGINYSVTQNSNGSSNQGGSLNPSITASRTLYDFGSLEIRMEAQLLSRKITEIQTDKAADDLFLEAISSFYEVQRALLQTRLARENLASRKAFVSFIRQRMEIGASSSADVIRAEARVAGALGTLSGSLESLSIARANYRKIFGKEAQPYILPQEIEIGELDVDNLNDYVMANPDLELVRLNLKIAEKELEDIFANRKGKISTSIRAARSYSESSGITSDTLSGTISFSTKIYDGGLGNTQVNRAELKIADLKFEERRSILALRQQLEDAFSQYDGKISAVSSKMLVLEGAKDSYGITKELYTFSRISLFEVLSAQEELFNSGKNLIDSIIDRAVAKYKLLYLCNQFEDIDGIL